MNIRSIDLQILIPRAADASRMQQQQDQLPAAQQQQIAGQFQQLTLDRRQQVQAAAKSEEKKIHNHDEKERPKQGTSHKQETLPQAEMNAQEKQQDPVRGNYIDIST